MLAKIQEYRLESLRKVEPNPSFVFATVAGLGACEQIWLERMS